MFNRVLSDLMISGGRLTTIHQTVRHPTAVRQQFSGLEGIIPVFLYLQVLDLLTTLVAFRMGATEFSPFIRAIMDLGPVLAVTASKCMGLGIGFVCWRTNKVRALRWITCASAAVVLWNLIVMFNSASVRPR
jgi:hypothetical protein